MSTANVKVMTNSQVTAVEGEEIPTDWLFVCMGGEPGPDLMQDHQSTRVGTGPGCVLPGDQHARRFFSGGDVRHGSIQRYASAVGEGAMAVVFVHCYLATG